MAPVKQGAYTYNGYDSSGDLLVTGTLWLYYETRNDPDFSTTITGEWDLQQVKTAENIGPQVGQGKLRGSVEDNGTVYIDLNPGWADNNVTLFGHFGSELRDSIDGDWSFSTFVGPVNSGRFEAKSR